MTAGRRNDGDTPTARIAIGGFQHQTNTFAPSLATQREFEMGDEWPDLTTGAGLPERVRGMNLPIVGFYLSVLLVLETMLTHENTIDLEFTPEIVGVAAATGLPRRGWRCGLATPVRSPTTARHSISTTGTNP